MRNATVTVRVPATSANLGPGFDTLGVALKLHNHVTLRVLDSDEIIRSDEMRDNTAALALTRDAVRAFFERSRLAPHGLDVEVRGDVPNTGGLGASVTVRLGIIYGLNELNQRPLSDAAVLELVSALERHPDNAAPALLGGFVVAGIVNGTVRYRRFNVPPTLKFIVCIPEFSVPTDRARALLPAQVPLEHAIENLNRTALIAAVFASGEFSMLRGLFADRLHQPYRKQLIPQLDEVIEAGVDAGALGGWLSGSGSAIMCLTEQKEKDVADAMARVFARHQIACTTQILVADNDGTRIRRG
ncbi:MAG: homoserine kinase [Verrucomicrobiae bacterium]|nr:homoserine kinase [Verrucomicrobiae bacterium]MDW8344728.1 homoserine kinase [Verrucomicrobiae bacterium]